MRRASFKSLQAIQIEYILKVLRYCDGNKAKAADKLDISLRTVSRYYENYREDYEALTEDVISQFLFEREKELMWFRESELPLKNEFRLKNFEDNDFEKRDISDNYDDEDDDDWISVDGPNEDDDFVLDDEEIE